jgi:hypothetical protein
MKKIINLQKVFSAVTILTVVFSPFNSFAPMIAEAGPKPPSTTYSISGTYSLIGAVLTVSGVSGVDNETGADGNQHMAVDWDTDQDHNPQSGTSQWQVANTAEFTWFPTFSGGGFAATWAGSHTYTSGSYSVRVMVYHGNTTGHDGSASLDTLVFSIVIPPTLTVIKHVVNDNGGTALASAFTMNVTGTNVLPVSSFPGSETGTTVTLSAGSYSVDESVMTGYTKTLSTDCTGTVVSGDNKICTVTNNDNPTNTPPVLSGVPTTVTIPEMAPYTFTATAIDTDVPPNTLTFSLIGAPIYASITLGGAFTWTPAENQGPESYPFTVRVSDGTNNTDANITIDVTEVNEAPVLTSIGNQSVNENTLLQFTISATDIDLVPLLPQSLTYSASNLPSSAIFDPITRTFSWMPSYTEAGTYTAVHFEVSDGIVTDSEDITITVNNVNRAPILNFIGNRIVNEGNLLEFIVSGSDPDEDTLSFSATVLPFGVLFDTLTQIFSWIPDFTQAGNYSVTFTVSDGTLDDSETVSIDVGNVDRSPLLSPIGNKTGENAIDEGVPFTFTATATDPDGTIPTYSLSGTVPEGASIDETTGVFSWTPAENQGPGSYTFTVVATSGSLTDEEEITIEVKEVNQAPIAVDDVATTPEDTTLNIPLSLLLANDTDADLTPTLPNTLTIISAENAVNGSVAISGSDAVFVPTLNFVGSASFEYTLSDGILTDTGLVSITVTSVNDVPTITLIGSNPLSLVAGDTFTDPGATGSDVEDGPLTPVITGTVDTSTPDTYTLTYTVTDSNGASASTTRTVIVTAQPVENTLGLCSDLIDNDNDELIDLADPDCSAFKPELTVLKVVVNDNDGTKVIADFPLFVDQTSVASGVQNGFNAGTYIVSETQQTGYTGTITGDCVPNGSITLSVGDVKSCTITNDDIAPSPSPTPSPSPSPAPSGGGGGGMISLSIFNEKNESLTLTQAVVSWFTNMVATTRVIYDTVSHSTIGASPNYGYAFSTVQDPNQITFHTVSLMGLTPGNTYYWRAVANQGGGTDVFGMELSFLAPAVQGQTTVEEQAPAETPVVSPLAQTEGEQIVEGATTEEQPTAEPQASTTPGGEVAQPEENNQNLFLASIGSFLGNLLGINCAQVNNCCWKLAIISTILTALYLFFREKDRKKKEKLGSAKGKYYVDLIIGLTVIIVLMFVLKCWWLFIPSALFIGWIVKEGL